jgi:hypothetical protein
MVGKLARGETDASVHASDDAEAAAKESKKIGSYPFKPAVATPDILVRPVSADVQPRTTA